MRKFTKLLILIFALAAIITAFTVVALAADPQPYTFTKNQAKKSLDFEGWDLNETFVTATNKDGTTSFIAIRETYPGGNKYMYFDGMGSNSGAANWYSEITYSRGSYDVGAMPIVALDFDVMSPNGSFGSTHNSMSFVLRPYYYNGSKYVQFGSSTTGAADEVALGQIGLKNEAYLWQHVTIVYEWVSGGTIKTYVYINGAAEPTISRTKDVSASYTSASNIDDTFFGVPYIRTAHWGQNSQVALDNYKQTYFPAGYDIADVPTYIYNDSYVMPEDYKYTVASVADAEGTTKYFDDLDQALATISDGCTLTLMEAPAKTLIINNAITLNTNGFDVTVESTAGYGITATVDGVHTIEKLPSVTVIWDACPTPDNCTCKSDHRYAQESEAVLGTIPEYKFDMPAHKEVNGFVSEFIGWSYENDGTVDELATITNDDIGKDAIYLYPVFEDKWYDLSRAVNGTVTYHTADEFASLFGTTPEANNVLVTLLRDATVYKTVTLSDGWSEFIAKVTLDLRGNTLTKIDLSGNKYSYDEATGDYVADGTLAASNQYVVSTTKGYVDFTLTSSADKNGTVISYRINGDVYYDADGNVVDYKASTVTTGNFLYFYNNAKYTLTVKNIDIYAGVFLYAQGNTNSNYKFTVDNCNYYKTVGSDNNGGEMFAFATMYDFTAVIKNSKFYYAKGLGGTNNFMRLYGKNNGVLNVTIDNCDIICETKQSLFAFYSSSGDKIKPTVTVKNSRIYNTNGQTSYTTYLDDSVMYSSTAVSYTTVNPGYVSRPSGASVPYTVPTSTILTIDANSGKPVMNLTPVTKSISFDYEVKKCSEVAESVTDARLSMLYYTNFNMVMYIPANEGMSDVSLSGFTVSENTVKIDGNEYYVFTKESTTTGVSDTVTAKLTYKVNGGSYRQTYKLSALVYADLMLSDPWMEVETKAIANMVRYIKEARLAAGLAAGAEFDELIALGNLADLGAKEDYVDDTVNYNDLIGYVYSINFMLDRTNAAYKIETVAENAEISVKFVGGEEIALTAAATANAKYTTGTRVYDIATKAIEITITLPAADGGEATVVSGTYSVKEYINATNDTLAKAMYEFGVAADAYRTYLSQQ